MINLIYKRLIVTLQSEKDAHFPMYHGSMLRGVIGQGLRRVGCTRRNEEIECHHCPDLKNCSYADLFYAIDRNREGWLKNVETMPNPYVIMPLQLGKQIYTAGDNLVFRLTLFGRAVQNIHYYVYSLLDIQNRGLGYLRAPFSLVSIIDEDSSLLLFHQGTFFYENFSGRIWQQQSTKGLSNNRLKITLNTPLRIQDKGNLTSNISFESFFRTVHRRICLASECYCSQRIEASDEKLKEKVREVAIESQNTYWRKLERFSSRQEKKNSIGGIMGSVIYTGDFNDFMPWIELGELLHIGKNTTFGLGSYAAEGVCQG